MPSLAALRPGSKIFKGLLIGASGSGKTGAYCELANLGYNLRILDFDNGLDIAGAYVHGAAAERLVYETLQDKVIVTPVGTTWVGQPKAYSRSVELMSEWKVPARKVNKARMDGTQETIELPAYNLGPVVDWTERDVLVLDSMTMQSNAIMRYAIWLLTGGKMSEERKLKPFQSDWGDAQNRQEGVLQYLYSNEVRCNVLICAHIRREGGGGVQAIEDKTNKTVMFRDVDSSEGKGFPTALGRALPPKVGRYFNTMLYFYTDSDGVRWVSTKPRDNIDCKTPCPDKLETQYRVEGGGFCKIFQTIRGEK